MIDRDQVKKAYRSLQHTMEGKLIIADLKAQFGGKVAREDAHSTAIRAGEYNVVQYIEHLMGEKHE